MELEEKEKAEKKKRGPKPSVSTDESVNVLLGDLTVFKNLNITWLITDALVFFLVDSITLNCLKSINKRLHCVGKIMLLW